MVLGVMSGVDPNGNPNPFSTEYGGDLRAWAAAVMLATVTLIGAFVHAGRTARSFLFATAVVMVIVSAEPARHYYRYFHCENGLTTEPCFPVVLHEIFQ